MALSDNRGSREFNKFVADGSGDASIRVTSTSSVTTSATAGAGSTTSGFATGTGTTTPTSGQTLILAATDVEGKSRIGIQIFNTGTSSSPNTQDAVYKVWGSLITTPGTVGGANWTQIGDDIEIEEASNAYKAISTTPIKHISATGHATGSAGTDAATTTNIYLMAD